MHPTLHYDDDAMMNCMTLIAGKRVSFNGRVLVAHNEDDPGHTAVRHAYVPAADWPAGTTIPAEEGCAKIPQVKHTFGYYWIEYKNDRGGLTSADSFINENGVVITSNSMGKSKEDSDDSTIVRDGGLGYNMRRVLAERSKTARHGVQVLIEMIETWGYALPGRAYTIADKDEAFMFQLVRGRHYIGARVPDDAVAVMPNHYNFHTLHDCPEMFYPEDIISYAVKKGWYTPEVPGNTDDFDFAAAYQHEETWHAPGNMLRQKNGQRLVLGRAWDPDSEGMPFVVCPTEKMDVRRFVEVMSTHYEGTEDDCERFGPGRSPHNVPNTRRICTGTTLECDVYVFADRPELTTVYSCFGRPCQLPFLPLHPIAGVPKTILAESNPAEMMAQHLLPEPDILVRTDSLLQRMRDFECRLEMVYSDEIDALRPILSGMLDDALKSGEATVHMLADLYAEDKHAEAAQTACARDEAFITETLARMQAYASQHASDIQIDALPPIDRAAVPETVTLTLHTCLDLTAENMIFGVEHTDTRQYYSAAIAESLKRVGENTYSVDFPTAGFMQEATCAGRLSFWLGGQDTSGRAFAALTIVEII